MRGSALRYLSVDLYKTLLFPKEDIAVTYARFGQKHLNFEFTTYAVSNQFAESCSVIGKRWPNFGQGAEITSRKWWNEVVS